MQLNPPTPHIPGPTSAGEGAPLPSAQVDNADDSLLFVRALLAWVGYRDRPAEPAALDTTKEKP